MKAPMLPTEQLPAFRPGVDILAEFLTRPIRLSLEAYRECGPIATTRFGGEEVVMLMGREANDFVWADSNRWDYPRSNVAFIEELTVDHLDATMGLRHRRRRQVMNPAFSREAVMSDLPVLADRLAAEVPAASSGGPVDFLRYWMELLTRHRITTAVIVDLDDELIRILVDWQYQFIHGITLGEARHAYYARAEYQALRSAALSTFRTIAEERLATDDGPEDHLAAVLDRRRQLAEIDGLPRLDLDAVTDDVYLLLVAGVDNIQMFATDILRECAADPTLADRLRDELDGWDGRTPEPLVRAPWWDATMSEIHRLRPQVPATTATVLYPVEDFVFAGHEVQAGTPVLHPMVLTQFLEEMYPDPFAFRPERFLDGGAMVPGTLGTFGGGTHRCIGRSVGTLQGAMIAAHLLVGYDLDGLPLPDPDQPIGDRSTRHHEQLPVTLTPRTGP